MNINSNDIHYTCTSRGYMLFYKSKPIGGAVISKDAAGCNTNVKMFKEQAEFEKRAILEGMGGTRYYRAISAHLPIREYASLMDYEIIGKLKPSKIRNGLKLHKIFVDEAGSEFWISKQGEITIVTPDGGVL